MADSPSLLQAVELGRLKADVRLLLQKIEWDGSETTYLCPCCRESKMAAHRKTCLLAQILEQTRPHN